MVSLRVVHGLYRKLTVPLVPTVPRVANGKMSDELFYTNALKWRSIIQSGQRPTDHFEVQNGGGHKVRLG